MPPGEAKNADKASHMAVEALLADSELFNSHPGNNLKDPGGLPRGSRRAGEPAATGGMRMPVSGLQDRGVDHCGSRVLCCLLGRHLHSPQAHGQGGPGLRGVGGQYVLPQPA